MNKLTPVIVVEAIEPLLAFWTDLLGFQVTATVPHGDVLGFAILAKGGVEVMYQTRDSVEDDAPAVLRHVRGPGSIALFIEVDDVDEVEAALEDVERVVPRRRTFYGMDEVFVVAPCGTVVGFAARVEG